MSVLQEDLREANARVRQAASKKEEHLRKVQQIADSVAVQLSSLEAQEKLFEVCNLTYIHTCIAQGHAYLYHLCGTYQPIEQFLNTY